MSDTPDQSAQEAALALEAYREELEATTQTMRDCDMAWWIDQGLSFDDAVEAAAIETVGRIPDQRVPNQEDEDYKDSNTYSPPPSLSDFDSDDEAELLSQPLSEGHINALEEFQAGRHQLYLDNLEHNLDNVTLGVNYPVPAALEQPTQESQEQDSALAHSEGTILVDDTNHATQPDLPIYGDKAPLIERERSLMLHRVSSGVPNPHLPAPRTFNWPRASSATEGESAAVKAWREAVNSEPVPCSVCHKTQRRDQITQVLCGHDFCRECLDTLFNDSLAPEALFPPHCCDQPIHLRSVESSLPMALCNDVGIKEAGCGLSKGVYCCESSCGRYIPPERIHYGASMAFCAYCRIVTCLCCKELYH
ncbi:hypothetical protein S7711_04704 [Stachybotrys chartarum IBT 7711]|uniref:RING-type domain-containing protein n=1 Tax=Stachybotrys chartarum (strain CBS 109288 / IBT 7711) TaxID=1280523 RepID=A0A084ANZ3_STACB|nr:hypothetical protein S7711_04704 [Stachybotrys chartarum IBT 7711]